MLSYPVASWHRRASSEALRKRFSRALVRIKSLQSCLTLRRYVLRSTSLLCPWGSPGKNIGVGCYFLLWGSSWPKDQTHTPNVSCPGKQVLNHSSSRASAKHWELLQPLWTFQTLKRHITQAREEPYRCCGEIPEQRIKPFQGRAQTWSFLSSETGEKRGREEHSVSRTHVFGDSRPGLLQAERRLPRMSEKKEEGD